MLGATVGTFDYAYQGPNDELTAVTAGSYAGPVGGSRVQASWVYDATGLLTSATTQGSRTTAYAYSAALLRLTSLTDAIGTRQVRYDAVTGASDSVWDLTDGWIRYVVAGDGRMEGPWIDGDGTGTPFRRTQEWMSNGGLVDLENDQGYAVGRWYRPSEEGPDTLPAHWEERHGSGGGLIPMADSATYDGWGRVIALTQRMNHGIVAADSFGFDARGNVTLNASGATFNVLDQLTSTAACGSHGYDAAGNLVSRTCGSVTWAYTYDALDRLTHVTNTAGDTVAYTYDVLGSRIAKKVNGVITRFVWRSGHVLYETTGGGTITYSYQWGLETDDLLAIHDHSDSAHYYVVQDRLRSVRGLVNRTGAWVAAWRYRAYGVGLDSAGSASVGLTRFRWAGAQYDAETGFYFLRTRSYDPSVGRFVQEDKVGRAGGANLYAYAGGDPLGRRDPGGTMFAYDLQYSGPLYEGDGYGGGGGGLWSAECIAWCDDWDQGDLTPWFVSQAAYGRYKAAHGDTARNAGVDVGEAMTKEEFHDVYSTILLKVTGDDPALAKGMFGLLDAGGVGIDVREVWTGKKQTSPGFYTTRYEVGSANFPGLGRPFVMISSIARRWGGKCFVNTVLHGSIHALRPAWYTESTHTPSEWRKDPIYYWADRWSDTHMTNCIGSGL